MSIRNLIFNFSDISNERVRFAGIKLAAMIDGTGGTLDFSTGLIGGYKSSPASTDIAVAIVASAGVSNKNFTLTGWTSISNLYSNDTFDANLQVAQKVLSTDFTLTVSGGTSADGMVLGVAVFTPQPTMSATFTAPAADMLTNTFLPTVNLPQSLPTTPKERIGLFIGVGALASTDTPTVFPTPTIGVLPALPAYDNFFSLYHKGGSRQVVLGVGVSKVVSITGTIEISWSAPTFNGTPISDSTSSSSIGTYIYFDV